MTPDTAARAGAIRWLVPLLLLVAAGAVRFSAIDVPERIYFDETYYVVDAAALLDRGVEEGFAVHPPLGKWVIGAGIGLLGDQPLGWRAASAAAGTLAVPLVYLAGLRLFRHRGPAALAGLAVAFDGLALVTSRIAMLDALLTLFVVAAFWLLLVDRDAQWRGAPEHPPPGDTAGRHPGLPGGPGWARWAAGAVLGLALATKWSAVLAIGAAGLLVLGGEVALRRRRTGRWATRLPGLLATVALPLVLVPALVYLASYGGWFANYERTRPGAERCPDQEEPCGVPLPSRLSDWGGEQLEIARFHLRLEADHPYRASALTWPTLARPIAYYYESCTVEQAAERAAEGEECVVARDHVSHILGMGNPALFWIALPAYLLLFWSGFRRGDWRALAIAAFLLGQYVPWLAAARPVFFFYAAPLVPFVAFTLAYGAWWALRSPGWRWVPAAMAVLVVAAFVFWYPLFSGMELPRDAWELRIWTRRWI